jgi:cytochrome c5
LVVIVPADTQALTKSTSTRIVNPNQNLTAIADALYCNSEAQAGRNIYCQACHASPHAIYPAITTRDNEQSIRLQGHSGPIVECVVCHMENPDEAFWHFGGDN